ncbi:MAG: class I adenylate-forming enzyme family protein [Acidimicrobiales bacterium]|nr:class I adenylate-forming enzyme family protein [Acidimicrobiales bacterium]
MAPEVGGIPGLLRARATGSAGRAALVHDDASITYAELGARTRDLAGAFAGAGLTKSSRVGVLMPNGIDWAVVAYAVSRTGATLVPLSTLLRPPELEAQLRQASVTHLVAVPRYRNRFHLDEIAEVRPRVPSLRVVWTADDLPSDPAPRGIAEALEERVTAADDLAILFTSGSRGVPKGVIHTHGNAIRAAASGLDARCIGPGERIYIPMPFFWTGGFASGLITALVAGATLLIESESTPAETIAFLERERATLFRGWPDQAARIAADPAFSSADLSSLGPGSLPAIQPPEQRPTPGTRANTFGMTETFGPYCGSRLDTDLPPSARGSCGKPFDGVEVRILDDNGHERGPGEQGEIAVRGPNVMRGIVGRLRSEIFTRDGYYRTGDLGHLDADGYLFYAGRVDDMFKVSGATVYPSEVEAALHASPLVARAFVTNVSDNGADTVGAAVVPSGDATVDDLYADARERLSAFKVPKRWAVLASVDDVPRLATGKVDKTGLQALLTSAPRPTGATP